MSAGKLTTLQGAFSLPNGSSAPLPDGGIGLWFVAPGCPAPALAQKQLVLIHAAASGWAGPGNTTFIDLPLWGFGGYAWQGSESTLAMFRGLRGCRCPHACRGLLITYRGQRVLTLRPKGFVFEDQDMCRVRLTKRISFTAPPL